MHNSCYRNRLSTSLRNFQSFSLLVSSLTDDSPVTGSSTVYKQSMNEAEEKASRRVSSKLEWISVKSRDLRFSDGLARLQRITNVRNWHLQYLL